MFRNTALAGTSTFKLLLGFGLCTLGGAMLYAYFKNHDDEDSAAEQKPNAKPQQHKQVKPAKEVTIKLDLPIEHIPLIVGRNGANLSSIENQTNTKIRLRDKNDKQKLCDITGFPDNVKQARSLLLKEMERDPIVKEEIFVPQSVCNKIVGRCGEALQEICRISLAKVSVDSGAGRNGGSMDKRCITITGNRQQVNIARKLIEDKIDEDEELRRAVEEVEQRREPRRSPTNSINSSMYSSQTSLSSHTAPRDKMLAARNDDKPMEVYVSAVASPSKFWVQIIGPQSKKLDDLVKTMTEYYNDPQHRARHEIIEPYLGQIVAVVFKYDSKWYRAEIVNILPNQYNPKDVVLDLYFVDYGDSEYVSPNEVFELRTDFLTLRFQAVECFMAGIKSTILNDSDTWEAQSVQKFEELTEVANWKKLISRVVTYKERPKTTDGAAARDGSPIPGVELFDLNEGVEVNLGHMLISHGFALPREEQRTSPPTSPETSTYQPTPTHTGSRSPSLWQSNESVSSTNDNNSGNAEDDFLEKQLQHLRKNNNLYLNGDSKVAAAAAETAANIAKMSSAEFLNDNFHTAKTTANGNFSR